MNNAEIISFVEKILTIVFSTPFIIFLIVLIFRTPILKILRILEKKFAKQELGEFEVGTSGVKAKFVKAETTLGETKVTVPKVQYDSAMDNLVTYTSGQYKFRISWNEKIYEGSSKKGEEIEKALNLSTQNGAMPFVIKRKKPTANFSPNVNVAITPIPADLSIVSYLHITVQDMKTRGFEVSSSSVDESTQSGFAEYRGLLPGENNFQFARIVLAFGLAYVVTASASFDSVNQSHELRDELKTILNSFELIKSVAK